MHFFIGILSQQKACQCSRGILLQPRKGALTLAGQHAPHLGQGLWHTHITRIIIWQRSSRCCHSSRRAPEVGPQSRHAAAQGGHGWV